MWENIYEIEMVENTYSMIHELQCYYADARRPARGPMCPIIIGARRIVVAMAEALSEYYD